MLFVQNNWLVLVEMAMTVVGDRWIVRFVFSFGGFVARFGGMRLGLGGYCSFGDGGLGNSRL